MLIFLAVFCHVFQKSQISVISSLTSLSKKQIETGKYLLKTSVREMYNDLIVCVWNNSKLLVSDTTTALRYLLHIQLEKNTPRYEHMCRCEI